MFDTFTNIPKEIFEQSKNIFNQIPKNEKEAREFFEKVKAVMQDESKNASLMWEIYQKSLTGDASFNEIKRANEIYGELLKSTRFAAILVFPGALFALPALVKISKEFGVDLVPATVIKHFAE